MWFNAAKAKTLLPVQWVIERFRSFSPRIRRNVPLPKLTKTIVGIVGLAGAIAGGIALIPTFRSAYFASEQAHYARLQYERDQRRPKLILQFHGIDESKLDEMHVPNRQIDRCGERSQLELRLRIYDDSPVTAQNAVVWIRPGNPQVAALETDSNWIPDQHGGQSWSLWQSNLRQSGNTSVDLPTLTLNFDPSASVVELRWMLAAEDTPRADGVLVIHPEKTAGTGPPTSKVPGEVTGNLYTDKSYDFTYAFPKGWFKQSLPLKEMLTGNPELYSKALPPNVGIRDVADRADVRLVVARDKFNDRYSVDEIAIVGIDLACSGFDANDLNEDDWIDMLRPRPFLPRMRVILLRRLAQEEIGGVQFHTAEYQIKYPDSDGFVRYYGTIVGRKVIFFVLFGTTVDSVNNSAKTLQTLRFGHSSLEVGRR
jgi:hypothetical protein